MVPVRLLIAEKLNYFMTSLRVVPVKVLIAENLNYFMTSLRGKNEVEVKFEKSMHNYNAIKHWDVSAVVLVLMMFTKWYPSDY